jgi:hypothetical protein
MIERGSYRLATDALRRLRDGDASPGRHHDRHSSQSIAGLARVEQVQAHALDYLYGRHGTSVALLGSADGAGRARPRRERTATGA